MAQTTKRVDAVLEAALKEAGIIKCQGLQDMFDLSRAFSWGKLPKGPNVAIISNAGGPAVISADLVSDSLLKLVPVDASTKEILEKSISEIKDLV
jgi:acetyltransferase